MNDERAYRALVERIRALLAERVPEGARVLVATRGDESLLRVPGRDARHFPQSPTGLYAGHYPAGGDEAVRHLDTLRERGADYLALPSTARWWLDHYPELSQRLEDEGELVADEPDTCVLFALERRDARVPPAPEEIDAAGVVPQVEALVRSILPDDAPVALVGPGADAVDTGARLCWRIAAPGEGRPVDRVLGDLASACRSGARYALLLNPDDPARALDGRLGAELARSSRRLFSRRQVEAFAVDSPSMSHV